MDRPRNEAQPCILIPTLSLLKANETAALAVARAGCECSVRILLDAYPRGYTANIADELDTLRQDAVILVDDCRVPEGWLSTLRDAVYEREALNVWFAGPSGPCRTYPQANGRPGDKRRPRLVSHLAGFCLYARREALSERLDRRLVHYGSDVEWQWRCAHKYNAKSLWVPSVYVRHELHEPHANWWETDQALLSKLRGGMPP